MRENMGLYRGKRTIDGVWIKGQLLFVEGKPTIYDQTDTDSSAVWECGEAHLWGCYEVDPETVGLCSGVPDKKGVKIYEGDVIRVDEDVKKTFPQVEDGPARFSRGGFYVGSCGNILCSFDVIADYEGKMRGEIIGTIYDIPEQLGVNGHA